MRFKLSAKLFNAELTCVKLDYNYGHWITKSELKKGVSDFVDKFIRSNLQMKNTLTTNVEIIISKELKEK